MTILLFAGAFCVGFSLVWLLRNIDSNTALFLLIFGTLLIGATAVSAHDHRRPDLLDWFKGLKNSGGAICCDGTDGLRVDDVDWETKDGKFRVRLGGQWIEVPDSAIVQGPNLSGPAMVWPYYGMGQPTGVRCFMPGTMT